MDLVDAIRDFQLIPPIDPALAEERQLTKRPETLTGLRIGLLDNRKGNANVLLTAVGEILCSEHGATEAQLFTKPIFSRPAPDELLDELCDFDVAITAIGD